MSGISGLVIRGRDGVAVVPLEQVMVILHPKQRALYEFVVGFWREHGYGPSQADLGRALGIAPQHARYHAMQLEAAGLLTHEAHKQRTLRPVELRRVA